LALVLVLVISIVVVVVIRSSIITVIVIVTIITLIIFIIILIIVDPIFESRYSNAIVLLKSSSLDPHSPLPDLTPRACLLHNGTLSNLRVTTSRGTATNPTLHDS